MCSIARCTYINNVSSISFNEYNIHIMLVVKSHKSSPKNVRKYLNLNFNTTTKPLSHFCHESVNTQGADFV